MNMYYAAKRLPILSTGNGSITAIKQLKRHTELRSNVQLNFSLDALQDIRSEHNF